MDEDVASFVASFVAREAVVQDSEAMDFEAKEVVAVDVAVASSVAEGVAAVVLRPTSLTRAPSQAWGRSVSLRLPDSTVHTCVSLENGYGRIQ